MFAINAQAVAAAAPFMEGHRAVASEVGHRRVGAHDHVAAIAAIAAVRPAKGYELLAPEGDSAVAAVPAFYPYPHAVEHMTSIAEN